MITENKKKNRQTTALIIRTLIEIIELYDDYRVTQHLSFISDKEDFYKWSNEKLLGELERYQNKLSDEYDEANEPVSLIQD